MGLAVELLAGLLPGAGLGAAPAALHGDGGPDGTDDDIGLLVMAIAPATLRPDADAGMEAERLFGTVLDCPPVGDDVPVRYPGWYEAERMLASLSGGVRLDPAVYRELCEVSRQSGLTPPGEQ